MENLHKAIVNTKLTGKMLNKKIKKYFGSSLTLFIAGNGG